MARLALPGRFALSFCYEKHASFALYLLAQISARLLTLPFGAVFFCGFDGLLRLPWSYFKEIQCEKQHYKLLKKRPT